MRGASRKLPVLAEISGPQAGDPRAWSLGRADLERMAALRDGLGTHRVVLVSGSEDLPAAIALAGAASAAGQRTALLECDLARPGLAADLGLERGPGLHEYLRWEATAPEILQPLVLAGPAARGAGMPLVCIVAGRPAADPATLVALASFRHAVAKLRAAYDLTVVVGPSLDTEDGSLEGVAAQTDAILAAISPEQASGRVNRALRAALRKLPADPVGAIVVGAA